MTKDVRDAVGAGDAAEAARTRDTGGAADSGDAAREAIRTAAPTAARLPGWTTRRWLTVGAGIALLVLAVLAGTGTWVLARSGTISDRLVDRNTPALIDSVRLESALVNQETGIRGYGLTGEPSFLDPYTTGLADQRTYTDRLRPLITGDASARRDLDLIGQQVTDWQEFLARPVAAAPPGAPVPLATERAAGGKTRFDAVRGSLTRFQADLQKTRNDTRADLNRVQRLRDWVFVVIVVLIAALAVLVFTGLRRGINRPLERLSADARTVAMGEFGHTVAASGPADIRQLATDVEGMRRRLADQLALTDAARARLDQQTVELRRSNSELEQFAYVASHDLQEPLRKVASFCQLLERRYAEALDDRARQYIGYAVDGANRMQVLINELLAFSRVGRVHAERRPVDTEALLARTVDSLSVSVAESGAELTHDPLPVVDGDPTLLGMLLQNLLSNALKFRSLQRPTRV
ncbi:MAG: hypothetical protein QOF98_3120, partial [Streptomyces sp.]|nr:hypothetical protein [Streptomyces sp.]